VIEAGGEGLETARQGVELCCQRGVALGALDQGHGAPVLRPGQLPCCPLDGSGDYSGSPEDGCSYHLRIGHREKRYYAVKSTAPYWLSWTTVGKIVTELLCVMVIGEPPCTRVPAPLRSCRCKHGCKLFVHCRAVFLGGPVAQGSGLVVGYFPAWTLAQCRVRSGDRSAEVRAGITPWSY